MISVAVLAWFFAFAATGGAPADETFDPTGYDLTWVETGTGTIDEDYATPINGAQSLQVNLSAQGPTYTYNLFSTVAEVKVRFKFRRESNTGTCVNVHVRAPSHGSVRARVFVNGDGTINAAHGGTTSAATSAAMSTATTYYMWFYYLQGTGANGVARVAFSLTDTEPAYDGVNGVETTTGTATSTVGTMCFGADASETMDFIYDDLTYILP